VVRANRLFSESTAATHFATLVAGRADNRGVELCNAGHCSPVVLGRNGTSRVESTGLPLGIFSSGRYASTLVPLEPGDSLVLFSDGITEAEDPLGNAYEEERLIRSLGSRREADPAALADAVLRDIAAFRGAAPQQDDMTLLIVRRLT